jgi:hypothetical protein
MFTSRRSLAHALILAAVVLMAVPAFARAQAGAPNVSVTTVVTALGPDYTAPPPITKADVNVYSRKNKLDVTGWEPAKGPHGALQLAILIDDAVSPRDLGLQFKDLQNFIESQPDDAQVGIYYAQFGSAVAAAKFSADHSAVAKKLRLTLGRRSGNSPSIYLSLSDLVKKWPASTDRREVLLITSGLDELEPGLQDPYFDAALANTEKAGVIVHSIYVGPLRLGLSFFGMIAQSNLGQITSQSGGDAFFQGLSTPISFAPFLQELGTILQNQYLLTFTAPASRNEKGELRPIQIRIEQRNVKLLYPHQVLVPAR